ncbi:ATP-dependent sacrificial sulfur transferase LarE [Candidatus Bathyarchaeota archaeon]|nr:ATP-dependent sacrificial sulfur transferase LarE [Candidatus Bathyarchaeota archaeon]
MKEETGIKEKFDCLINILKNKESVLVAFSGGVDSTVVAAAAKIALKDKALAATINSPLIPLEEVEEALKTAKEIGISHVILEGNELEDPNFTCNSSNRCYFCKKNLAFKLRKLAKERGLKNIVDGTNAEDLKDYRPGWLALREEGVSSPLVEAGLTKEDVRKIAKILGLSIAGKPSSACLASRIPYGEKITLERLKRIADSERFIKKIVKVKQVRVRDHGIIARIEVDPKERRLFFNEKIMDEVSQKLRSLGFKFVALELEGYAQGNMNKLL